MVLTIIIFYRPVLQVIIIKRGDNGQWAFPGGMVDPGENVSRTAVREFLEEATNFLKANEGFEFYVKVYACIGVFNEI